MDEEPIELDALLWAWTNLMGRLPDDNTMTEDEIKQYWLEYADVVRRAIVKLTAGVEPDAYLKERAMLFNGVPKT